MQVEEFVFCSDGILLGCTVGRNSVYRLLCAAVGKHFRAKVEYVQI